MQKRNHKRPGTLSLKEDEKLGRALRLNARFTDKDSWGEETGDSLTIDTITYLNKTGSYKSDRELINELAYLAAIALSCDTDADKIEERISTAKLIGKINKQIKQLQDIADKMKCD